MKKSQHKPTHYQFWRELFESHEFDSPYASKEPSLRGNFFVFSKGPVSICISANDLHAYKFPTIVFKTQSCPEIMSPSDSSEFFNVLQIIEALFDRKKLFLCFHISWALPLIEALVKQPVGSTV